MKIALFNTHDRGGAGKAAHRLNKGLNRLGEKSDLFVKYKSSDDPSVKQIRSVEIHNSVFDYLADKYFVANTFGGNTMNSIMYPSVGFDFIKPIEEYDIINLHWISMFVSVEAIRKMHEMKKPIVWTLHDQNPMTGACHYSHGCQKYRTDCAECSQLVQNPFDITRHLLAAKIKYLPSDITLVSPSRWLADCARNSRVFKGHRIEVIQNSLETEIYFPRDKEKAKEAIGIDKSCKVILFGAQDLKENRKGLRQLIEAITYLKKDEDGANLLKRGQLSLCTFGVHSPLLDSLEIPYRSLGYVTDDHELSQIYSAADVLALPSLEDNLPNMLLETLSCGTPVVAFSTGGMQDVIENGVNGYLADLNDTHQFARNILKVLTGLPMGKKCRTYALQHFQLSRQASRYRELYEELCRKPGGAKAGSCYVPKIFPDVAPFLTDYLCEASEEIEHQLEASKQETGEKENVIKKLISDQDAEISRMVKRENQIIMIKDDEITRLGRQRDSLSVEIAQMIEREKQTAIQKDFEIVKYQQERDEALGRLNEITCSKSWKITRPLRFFWKAGKKTLKFMLPYAVVKYYQNKENSS